jgi:hypothetical protein
MVKLILKRSTNPKKKMMAVFTYEDGKTKTTHFGARGMDDYTITKDKEQRKRYRDRHKKDLSTKDPTKAGYLSYYILWGESTSKSENISKYKKRFGFS